MSNYWVSQKRRFCEDCKCWIADHPASIVSHEGGTKHFANAQRRLAEMRRRGAAAAGAKRQEDEWVKQMEEAALKDYRTKDLGLGADIQARRVNKKREEIARERGIDPIALPQREPEQQRDTAKLSARTNRSGDDHKLDEQEHQERADAAAAEEKKAAKKRPAEGHMKPAQPVEGSSTIGPEIPFSVFKGTTSGTKYHNKPRDTKLKMWYEAKTEAGVTYYWHVETKQSRWTAPPEGYFSIGEQEDVNRKHNARENRKIEKIYEQQAIHGKEEEEFADVAPEANSDDDDDSDDDDGPPGGERVKIDHGPYGKWQVVEKKREKREEEKIDFQAPRNRSGAPVVAAAAVAKEKVEFKFKQKAMPSLGNSSSGGGGEAFFKKRKTEGKRQLRRGNMDD